jgi:hypothetical protein
VGCCDGLDDVGAAVGLDGAKVEKLGEYVSPAASEGVGVSCGAAVGAREGGGEGRADGIPVGRDECPVDMGDCVGPGQQKVV